MFRDRLLEFQDTGLGSLRGEGQVERRVAEGFQGDVDGGGGAGRGGGGGGVPHGVGHAGESVLEGTSVETRRVTGFREEGRRFTGPLGSNVFGSAA